MDSVLAGVNFVDGNMEMQVVGVAVDGTDALVFFKA
jgi:hypothetical protein